MVFYIKKNGSLLKMEEQRRGTGEKEQRKRRDLCVEGPSKIILSRSQARLSAGLTTGTQL